MLLTDREGRAPRPRVQPTVTTGVPLARRRGRLTGAAPAALLLMLAGCSAVPNAVSPVTWWHDLEGGEIAKDRPPPPNPNAPYPHIAAAPTRPAGMPDWEWAELSKTLAAQREAAQHYAAQNPIPALPVPPGSAKPTTKAAAQPQAAPSQAAQTPATAAPAGNDAGNDSAAEIARLAAAPGPAGSNASANLPSQAIATATGAAGTSGNGGKAGVTFNGPTTPASGSGPTSVPIPGAPNGGAAVGTKYGFFDANNGLSVPGATGPIAQPDEAHPPAVPTTVPVPPVVPGFAIPTVPSTYTPPPALPQPAPYVPPPPLPNVPPVPVAFAPHSAVLTPPMQRALLNLVQARQGANLAVTGFGDAAGTGIEAQAAAMPLALERARALLVQLMADGVSPSVITTDARAQGSGGLARLVD